MQELALGAEHRQVVFGAPLPFIGPGKRVEGTRHPEMVEGDVAQGDVLLELGSSRDPFPEALGQHEVVVGVRQQHRESVVEVHRRGAGRGGTGHMCPTSSGIT